MKHWGWREKAGSSLALLMLSLGGLGGFGRQDFFDTSSFVLSRPLLAVPGDGPCAIQVTRPKFNGTARAPGFLREVPVIFSQMSIDEGMANVKLLVP